MERRWTTTASSTYATRSPATRDARKSTLQAAHLCALHGHTSCRLLPKHPSHVCTSPRPKIFVASRRQIFTDANGLLGFFEAGSPTVEAFRPIGDLVMVAMADQELETSTGIALAGDAHLLYKRKRNTSARAPQPHAPRAGGRGRPRAGC